MPGRVVAVLALAGGAALAAGAATRPAASVPRAERPAAACGIERWSVKTLTDAAARNVVFSPRYSSVDALRRVPNPGAGFGTPRLPGPETTTYRIPVRLVQVKLELDRDIHLVVASPRTQRTMIVELPSPTCTRGARARYAMVTARARLIRGCGQVRRSWRRIRGAAILTGVGFFDVLHGQRGVAPNGIELHPVVGFRTRNCR